MLSPDGGKGGLRRCQQEGPRSFQAITSNPSPGRWKGTALMALQARAARCYPPDPPNPRPISFFFSPGDWAHKRKRSMAWAACLEKQLAGDVGSSSAGEPPPRALTEPDVRLSPHPARPAQPFGGVPTCQ